MNSVIPQILPVIMASGKGSRMIGSIDPSQWEKVLGDSVFTTDGGETTCCKALIPIRGRTLLQRQIDQL